VDEHGMVLAIQAAHRSRANLNSLTNIEEGNGGGAGMGMGKKTELHRSVSYPEFDGRGVDIGDEQNLYRMPSMDDGGSNASDRNHSKDSSVTLAKLSPQLFLIVVSIYCTCLWVHVAVYTLIPVWLVIPVSAGGMEYTVREVAIVLSSAAMWCMLGHKIASHRTDHMLKTSPIRALRIGCGLLMIVLFFLPCFMEFTLPSTEHVLLPDLDGSPLSPAAMEDLHAQDHRVQFITVFGRSLPSQAPISFSTFVSADHHNVAYDYVHWASSKYTFPTRSILALQMPALLFALMCCGLQICRRASGIILQLTLCNTFQDPASVRRALNGLVEIGGPTLAAALFSLSYGMGLHYPMDASSFFSIGGCQIMLVYIASILLKVQFRGDYGVMVDYEESTGSSSSSARVDGSGRPALGQEGPEEIILGQESTTPHAYLRNTTRRSNSSSQLANHAQQGAPSRISELAKVFNIVIGDASLLYSPVFSAYGSKLYNLKDDFKDV
jgi:hypothetical protein